MARSRLERGIVACGRGQHAQRVGHAPVDALAEESGGGAREQETNPAGWRPRRRWRADRAARARRRRARAGEVDGRCASPARTRRRSAPRRSRRSSEARTAHPEPYQLPHQRRVNRFERRVSAHRRGRRPLDQVPIRNEADVQCGETARIELRTTSLRFERGAKRCEIVLLQDLGLRACVAAGRSPGRGRRFRAEQVHHQHCRPGAPLSRTARQKPRGSCRWCSRLLLMTRRRPRAGSEAPAASLRRTGPCRPAPVDWCRRSARTAASRQIHRSRARRARDDVRPRRNTISPGRTQGPARCRPGVRDTRARSSRRSLRSARRNPSA